MRLNPLLIAGAAGLILLGANTVLAQETTTPPSDTTPAGDVSAPPADVTPPGDVTTPPATPPVTPPGHSDKIGRGLVNAPPEVQKLVQGFETTRDKYLTQQRELLAQLKGATADQRAELREKLVANRDAFMAELKTFRQQFQADLAALKPKLSRPEMQRLINAAKDATQTPGAGGHAHKGGK